MPSHSEDVLWTKLRVPRPPAVNVARPRLAERLDAGHRSSGLVVLCAPAGFGKSTLLADYFQRCPDATAWLALDQADNDPTRFWRHAATSLDHAIGDESQILSAVERAAMGEGAAGDEAVVTALINALARDDRAVNLVIDDYHLIETEAINRSVGYLIHHAPPTLRLVIATRVDPPLQLPRLRAQGRLIEIRAADLRFSATETGELLNTMTGTRITNEVAATLTNRTEGWAAGLQLAGLSFHGGTDPESFASTFTGEHRFVLDYLAEEVLDRQPGPLREFLLQTSILDRLSGPLCDAVTDRGDAQQTLEAIETANLFLVPLDDHRRWWRYHHLFADLLRVRLHHEAGERLSELHLRAAEWHLRHGDVDRAIHHTWEAGDRPRAAELIEDNADALLLRREGATLQRWLDRLPKGLVDSRRLTLARARIATYGGRVDEAEELLDLADQMVGDPPPGSVELTSAPRSGPLNDLDQMTVLLRAFVAHMRGQARAAMDLAASVADNVGETSITGLIAQWHLAAGPWLLGEVDEAEPALAANVAAWRHAGQHDRAALSAQRLGRIQQVRGNLDAALNTYQQVLEHDIPHTGAEAPAAGVAHVGMAEVAYQRNDLGSARVHARLGISMCDDFTFTQPLAAGWSILARIHQAEGDADAAREAMATAIQVAPGSDVVDLLNPIPAQMAQLSIARGDIQAASRWAQTRSLSAPIEPTHQREPAHLAVTRLLLKQGEPAAALSQLDGLRSLAAGQGRYGSLLEIEMLRARALEAVGDRVSAFDALKTALELAAPHGHIRVFADEGQPMADLLAMLQQRSDEPVSTARPNLPTLIEICQAQAKPVLTDPSPNDVLVVPLTERELEVLAELTAGKQNKDISAGLYISLNTVKKHITHIFDKLGVTNRTAAVSRARELGL